MGRGMHEGACRVLMDMGYSRLSAEHCRTPLYGSYEAYPHLACALMTGTRVRGSTTWLASAQVRGNGIGYQLPGPSSTIPQPLPPNYPSSPLTSSVMDITPV